ncbi:MAG: hypothetical protein A2W00_01720 [Candidatus Eisenbacteria bacterium RBG_16_71_46]|nr:MAG: hypothetical protein A2W00_01720 [Candidatus Eisenbacteria bacterium RBG_16_71_46]
MSWRLQVVLMARNDEHDDGEGPIPVGRTSDREAVRVVADALIAEAREHAEGLGTDPVLHQLTQIEAERLERTIEALLPASFPSGPRLVPDRGGDDES